MFYCVLALTVAHLMRRQAEHAGLHMSVRELLDELSGIQKTVLLYHDGGPGRPRAQRLITDMNPTGSVALAVGKIEARLVGEAVDPSSPLAATKVGVCRVQVPG